MVLFIPTSINFNPHSRKGSDGGDRKAHISCQISIHTPARGVTRPAGTFLDGCFNFNPHSRKGSDRQAADAYVDEYISIHTPARGVTLTLDAKSLADFISIHTPARGVTRISRTPLTTAVFQSTLPQGE